MKAARFVFALLPVALGAAMPFVTASCGKKACFRWSEAEGACPSADAAHAFFDGPTGCATDIVSVDGEAEYDGELCCYDVTHDPDSERICVPGDSSTVTTGVAASSGASSGTGTVACDGTGLCGDGVSGGCVECALASICAGELSNCSNDAECSDFASCLNECVDQDCVGSCAKQFPAGAQLYNAVLDCILCNACPIDCAQNDFADPFPGCQ